MTGPQPENAPPEHLPVSTPYGPPQPRPQPRGTNGLAITALIFGIVPCLTGLLGIVFGVIALTQLRRSGQKGKGMAISGIVLGSLWLIGAGTVAVISIVQEQGTDRTHSGSVKAFSLRTGDCVKDAMAGERIVRVTLVPCTDAHRAEVVGVTKVSGSAFPGDAAVEAQAQTDCNSALKNYAPEAAADESVDLLFYMPTRSSWSGEAHNIICLAEFSAPRSGSIH